MCSATHMSQPGLARCDSTGQLGTAGLKMAKAVLFCSCFYPGFIVIYYYQLLITLYGHKLTD